MEALLWHRVGQSALFAPGFFAAAMVPLQAMLPGDSQLLLLVTGTLLLAPAQLLGAAAVLQRSNMSWLARLVERYDWVAFLFRLGAAGAAAGIAAFASTLLAKGFIGERGAREGPLGYLISMFFGGIEVFGCITGAAMMWHLNAARALTWPSMPKEATHRRLKLGLTRIVLTSARTVVLCFAIASFASVWPGFSQAFAELAAAMVVILVTEVHVEALKGCTSFAHVMRELETGMPLSVALTEALQQPLSATARGTLGRWVAMALLAQAVAHRQQECMPHTMGMVSGAGLVVPTSIAPPLAQEMFNFGANVGTSWQRSKGIAANHLIMAGARSSGLFPQMLKSGLETLREFTIRLRCLEVASRKDAIVALGPVRVAILDSSVAEMEPLARLSATCLAGWICLSKSLDTAGIVVQREDALHKTMHELCGVLDALERLQPALARAETTLLSGPVLRSVEDEVKLCVQQLLVTFESSGLAQVALPPDYKQLLQTHIY